jgi:hypothetical protein
MNWKVLNVKRLIVQVFISLIVICVGFADLTLSSAWAAESVFASVTPDQKPLQILGPAGEQFRFIKTGKTPCVHIKTSGSIRLMAALL